MTDSPRRIPISLAREPHKSGSLNVAAITKVFADFYKLVIWGRDRGHLAMAGTWVWELAVAGAGLTDGGLAWSREEAGGTSCWKARLPMWVVCAWGAGEGRE